MPPGPITETSRARCSRPVAWNSSLSSRSSSSRPTNGASRPAARLRPPTSATIRSARHAATGSGLARDRLRAHRLVRDAGRGRPLGRLADPDTAGVRRGLETRRGVDEVARDHPLARPRRWSRPPRP